MKTITSILLFVSAILAQDVTQTKAPTPKPEPPKVAWVDESAAMKFENIALKIELIQRRVNEELTAAKEQVAELQKQQEGARLSICKESKLPDSCIVSQDPKTGKYSVEEKAK